MMSRNLKIYNSKISLSCEQKELLNLKISCQEYSLIIDSPQ